MSVLHLLIPVYNEEGNVEKLIQNIESLAEDLRSDFELRVVFVDDGSDDGTAGKIESSESTVPVTVLPHRANKGPGAAFATGFEVLRSDLSPGDWVVTMEGDNTSRLDTLKQMLVRRLEGYEVVLASPYAYGGGFNETSRFRVLLSHIANGLSKVFLGIRGILCFSSFFRLYNYDVLQRLYKHYGSGIIEVSGFGCMLELLCKLIYVNATMSEVAMTLDTSERAGASKMRILQTVQNYFTVFSLARKWKRQSQS